MPENTQIQEIIPNDTQWREVEDVQCWTKERVFHEFFAHICGDSRNVVYLLTRGEYPE